jgi:hypothetical protein
MQAMRDSGPVVGACLDFAWSVMPPSITRQMLNCSADACPTPDTNSAAAGVIGNGMVRSLARSYRSRVLRHHNR